MAGIEAVGGRELVSRWVRSGRPLLGICVGLQVLFAELRPVSVLGATFDLPVLASASLPAVALAACCAQSSGQQRVVQNRQRMPGKTGPVPHRR